MKLDGPSVGVAGGGGGLDLARQAVQSQKLRYGVLAG